MLFVYLVMLLFHNKRNDNVIRPNSYNLIQFNSVYFSAFNMGCVLVLYMCLSATKAYYHKMYHGRART